MSMMSDPAEQRALFLACSADLLSSELDDIEARIDRLEASILAHVPALAETGEQARGIVPNAA